MINVILSLMIQSTTVVNVNDTLVIKNPVGPVSVRPVNGYCYPNCDGSTTAPMLNVLDFSCFQNTFSACMAKKSQGEAYQNDLFVKADCNQDRVLNVLDFSCFNNAFVAGCNDYVVNGRVNITNIGTDWIITSNCPFIVSFEVSRKVVLREMVWYETLNVTQQLANTDQWLSDMLPATKILESVNP